MESFLPKKGNYRALVLYQKAECLYDITYYFAQNYLSKGDRTIDQMIQAARSGKQNIAEGSAAGATSSETEIKLMNVARASFQELLTDYEDYLRVRNLEQWIADDPRSKKTRQVSIKHNDSKFYREAIKIKPESIGKVGEMIVKTAKVSELKILLPSFSWQSQYGHHALHLVLPQQSW